MATISLRMDDALKRQTESILEQLGLNMTTAMTMFAKAIVRERRIPLDLCLDPFYSAENLSVLNRSIAEYEAGNAQTVSKTMEELKIDTLSAVTHFPLARSAGVWYNARILTKEGCIMTDKEMVALEIDRYTDLQRIVQAGDNWRTELNYQMMKARAKLESYGVPVEPLSMNPVTT